VLLSPLLPLLVGIGIDDDDGDGDGDDDDDSDDDGDNSGGDDGDEDDEDSVLSSTAPTVEAIVAAVVTGDGPTIFPGNPEELYCCRATTAAPCRGSAMVVFGPG